MQLAPGSTSLCAVLQSQPPARPAQLEAGAVHHQMQRPGSRSRRGGTCRVVARCRWSSDRAWRDRGRAGGGASRSALRSGAAPGETRPAAAAYGDGPLRRHGRGHRRSWHPSDDGGPTRASRQPARPQHQLGLVFSTARRPAASRRSTSSSQQRMHSAVPSANAIPTGRGHANATPQVRHASPARMATMAGLCSRSRASSSGVGFPETLGLPSASRTPDAGLRGLAQQRGSRHRSISASASACGFCAFCGFLPAVSI